MRTLLGLVGITLAGIGIASLLYDWRIGLYVGLIVLGTGLFADTLRK